MATVAPKLILDNRVNVSESFDELVKYSGVNVNYFEIQPDGATFPTQVLFNNIVVPNLSTTLVSRNLRLHYDVTITYPQGNINAPQLSGVYDDNVAVSIIGQPLLPVDTVLRGAAPLQMNCTSTSVTINSGTNTINSQQVIDPLMRRQSRKYLMNEASEAPSQLDTNWRLTTDAGTFIGRAPLIVPVGGPYANWAAVVGAGVITTVVSGVSYFYTPTGAAAPPVGSLIQLTAPAGYNAFCLVTVLWASGAAVTLGQVKVYQKPVGCSISNQPTSDYLNSNGSTRASFLPSNVVDNAGIISVTYNLTEQVYLSPLTLFSSENFLANVNTLSLLFNYSDLTKMFVSANPNVAISSVVISSPRLSLTYIQINPEVMSIPRSVSYNFENVVYFSKTQPWSAGNPNLLQSDSIRLQAMPSQMYVLARIPMASQTIANTNTFLQLGQGGSAQNGSAGVSINIGNRTGLGASASTATWWRIAKRNGWAGSYNEYLRSSSCICFSPVEDLGVDPSLDSLPMTSGSINFQINAYFNDKNVQYAGSAFAGQVELLIVAVYAGVATITTDQIMFNLGALSNNEVNATLASAGKSGQTYSSEHVQPTIQGAGLASSGKYVLSGMASKHQRSKLSM
jgi:hypothetical protein